MLEVRTPHIPQGCRHGGVRQLGSQGHTSGKSRGERQAGGGGTNDGLVSLPVKRKVPVGCTTENAQQVIRDIGARSKDCVKTARAKKLTWNTQELQRFAKISEVTNCLFLFFVMPWIIDIYCPGLLISKSFQTNNYECKELQSLKTLLDSAWILDICLLCLWCFPYLGTTACPSAAI